MLTTQTLSFIENLSEFFGSFKLFSYTGVIEWYYSLSGISKATRLNFFTLADYKIEVSMFLSLCVLLVLASLRSDIKKLVSFSKWTMFLVMSCEFITIKFGFLTGFTSFGDSYKVNMYTQSAKVFILLIAILLIHMFFVQNEQSYSLVLLLHTLVFLASIIVSVNNGFLLLITLENFSLLLYILTLTRKTYGGIAAGVKYFVFGTLGSIIVFWGLVNVYMAIKSTGFTQIDWFNNQLFKYNYIENIQSSFATSMIAIGLIIKFGVVPSHLWIADVYAGVPLYITAWFAIFVKIVLFTVFWQFGLIIINDIILDVTSIFSIIVGTWMTLRQVEIKRLIAYGSIVHFSFIAMGSMQSAAIYLITYTVASILLFFVLLELQVKNGKEFIYLEDLMNIRSEGVYFPIILISSFVSLAGLPPFAGFFGKFEVWKDLIEGLYVENCASQFVFLLLSLSLTLVVIFYYLRMVAYMFLRSDSKIQLTLKSGSGFDFSWHFYLFMIMLFWVYIQGFIFY